MQVLALTALALGVARLARAPKGTWRYILGVAAAILLASQFLPAGHPFREDVAESSYNLAWLGIALIPVGIYGLWIRRLRVRSGADAPEPAMRHPVGLVQIAEDSALAADTASAIDAAFREAVGAEPESFSLGWRDADGALCGHLRLRHGRDLAEIVQLWVAPDHQRRGYGRALVGAASREARARGAARLGVLVAAWQAQAFFEHMGFAQVAELPAGGAESRAWYELALA